jgi:hypothetical protein
MDTTMSWYRISTGQFGYPQPEDTYLEETYDLSAACPTCEIGKKLKNAFRLSSEPKAKHSQFIGLNWVLDEVFVRDVVKSMFDDQGITGAEFTRPLRHKTGEPLETIYHLRVGTFLPAALRTEKLRKEKCELPDDPDMIRFLIANGSKLVKGPFCGATKFNYPRSVGEEIAISASAFMSAPDLVRTHEWFGSASSAGRPILISQRVKDIIDRMKWRGLKVSRINVVND